MGRPLPALPGHPPPILAWSGKNMSTKVELVEVEFVRAENGQVGGVINPTVGARSRVHPVIANDLVATGYVSRVQAAETATPTSTPTGPVEGAETANGGPVETASVAPSETATVKRGRPRATATK